jgi:hypothetical protein
MTTTDAFDDDRLSAWLDGELDATARGEVDAALEEDPAWGRALAEVAETRTLVRGMGPAEPPPGFLASLLDQGVATVTDLDAARSKRARRVTSGVAALAAAAAILIAVVVPGVGRARPALATDVRVHQAGVSASGDPISGLAPLGTPMKFGR